MISFRHFLNIDPPLLTEIWREQTRFPELVSNISCPLLEEHVFSKPWFEPQNLLLALAEKKPLGFCHFGFASKRDESDLDPETMVLCQLRIVPGEHYSEVLTGLMQRALDRTRELGARQIYFGSRFPIAPFYAGFYGGSRVPGVIPADQVAIDACEQFGFEQVGKVNIYRCSLSGFRKPVGRKLRKIQRCNQIQSEADPGFASWIEACTMLNSQRMRFTLIDRIRDVECGQVSFWDMEPLPQSWGVTAMGMYGLVVDDESRRSGLATYLLGETLRHLEQQAIGQVEAQVLSTNEATIGLLEKLGFELHGHGQQRRLEL